MRIDLLDVDGLIQTTPNIPDALWTPDVQAQAAAAARKRGMTIDTSPLNDTLDHGIPSFGTSTTLLSWISNQTSDRGTGPIAAPVSSGAITAATRATLG